MSTAAAYYYFVRNTTESVTVTPSPSVASGLTADPTVQLGSVSVAPAASVANGLTADPDVLSSGAVTPAASVANGLTVDPAVVLGSSTFTPAASVANGQTADPTVVLGSVSITPAASVANGLTVDPGVLNGVTLTPTAALADGLVTGPAVFMSSTTFAPDALPGIGLTVDPSVILSGEGTGVPPLLITSLMLRPMGSKLQAIGLLSLSQNGVTVLPQNLGLQRIDDFQVPPQDGYVFQYVPSTGVLTAFWGDYDNPDDGPLIASGQAILTDLLFEAVGV